jgi:hypothetical protein
VFHDLDTTLAELLRTQLPTDVVEQVTISFATPVSGSLPSSVALPALNLFLYQIEENLDLRSNEAIVQRMQDGTVKKGSIVRRVDCNYLITAWAKDTVSLPDQDEHRLLGEVVRVLLRFREIPAAVLRGSMADQPIPPRGSIFQINQQARGDFWRALGDKPKAAFNYVATIAIEIDDTKEAGRVGTSFSI